MTIVPVKVPTFWQWRAEPLVLAVESGMMSYREAWEKLSQWQMLEHRAMQAAFARE